MRDRFSIMEARNAASGIILGSSVISITQVGAAFDTLGFKEVLAVLAFPGYVIGSAALATTARYLYATIEESAVLDGTTTAWSVINDGAYTGTCQMTAVGIVASSTGASVSVVTLKQSKLYERLNDGVRKRFIRGVVYSSGLAGSLVHIPYALTFIFDRAQDTAQYVTHPTITGTNCREYSCNSYASGTDVNP